MGLLAIAGVINLPFLEGLNLGSASSAPTVSSQAIKAEKLCGDDNLADLRVRWRNGANTNAANYVAEAVSLVAADNNQVLASYTANADGTFAATANALQCGRSYFTVTLNDGTAVATKTATKVADSSIIEFDTVGANSSQIEGNMYSLSFGNETNTANSFATGSQDFTTVTNTALGTGDTVTLRFDISTVDASSQFGATERICETNTGVCGKAFVCATGASSIYASDDLSVSAPFVIGRTAVLPSLCASSAPTDAGVGRTAFEIDAITSGMGRVSGTYTIRSGLGNAADTNNVRFIYMDNSFYQGSNGALKQGTSNDALSDTGETNNYMEANIT